MICTYMSILCTCATPAPISPAPNTAIVFVSCEGLPKRFFLHCVCPKKRLLRAFDSLDMPRSPNPIDSASYPATSPCSSPIRIHWRGRKERW